MPTVGDDRQLIEFVHWEARLIDEKRFDEWYGLFADEALYWMPLARDQPPGEAHTSLLYEDKLLRAKFGRTQMAPEARDRRLVLRFTSGPKPQRTNVSAAPPV